MRKAFSFPTFSCISYNPVRVFHIISIAVIFITMLASHLLVYQMISCSINFPLFVRCFLAFFRKMLARHDSDYIRLIVSSIVRPVLDSTTKHLLIILLTPDYSNLRFISPKTILNLNSN